MQKSFLQSKTLWVNLLGVILTVVSATEFQGLLPAEAVPYIAFVVMLINAILRSMKDEPSKPIAFAMPKTVETRNFATFHRQAYRPVHPSDRPPAA